MSKSLLAAFSLLGLAVSQAPLSATAADAAFVCKDGFQLSEGQWISTPYCNDAHLAQIAREHGSRVTAAEIRGNPNKKYEICRFVGSSPEARDYCPDDGGRDR